LGGKKTNKKSKQKNPQCNKNQRTPLGSQDLCDAELPGNQQSKRKAEESKSHILLGFLFFQTKCDALVLDRNVAKTTLH